MSKDKKKLEFPEEQAQRLENEAAYIAFLDTMPKRDDGNSNDTNKDEDEDEDKKDDDKK